VVIVQVTTDLTKAPLFRLPVDPNERNRLRGPCRLRHNSRFLVR